MNHKEVFALFFGIIGFILLRIIYLGDPIPSPHGYYDLRSLVFIFGFIFIFIFRLFIGQENR